MSGLSFTLDDHQREAREDARRLAAQVEPFAAEADAATVLHLPTFEALRASRLCEHTVPRPYGGRSERLEPLAITLIREQLMAVSAHLDSLFGMQGVGSFAIAVGGSEELRREWLPKVAGLETIAALALTEPAVGSDLRAISTRLAAEGDELRVDGRKSFITNAGASGFYTVLAREGDDHSLVLVPADAAGVTVVPGPDLIAPHILGEVELDGVRVPSGNRIGARGEGFKLALSTLATFRVSVAGSGLGLAEAALVEATRHAADRVQFGKPLLEIGSVSQALASSWAEIEAARAMTYRAAAAAAADPLAALDLSSIAKVVSTETAGRVVDRCLQTAGRFGLVTGSKLERLYRNARPLRIYEGSTEVILDSLSRRLTKRSPWT